MSLIKRLKNLVELSKYHPKDDGSNENTLVKDFFAEKNPKGMATIIKDKPDLFKL